jgi:hypothetical protein
MVGAAAAAAMAAPHRRNRASARAYHETGETAALRYILKYLYLARNNRLYLRAHSEHQLAANSRLHSAAWQLATFSGARCNDENTLLRVILYINCAYQISGADGRARE